MPRHILGKEPPFSSIPLSIHQRVCGGLFGDGTLDFFRNKKTDTLVSARYRERQGLLHRDWVENQQQGLFPLTDGIKKPEPKQDKNGYWFIEARTRRVNELLIYGTAFYNFMKTETGWKAIKQVPKNSGELLDNPLSLSVWIAGDGRPKANGDFTLCTQGFTLQENEFLKDILNQNWKVTAQVKVYSNGKKKYPELYIRRSEARKLLEICDKQIASLKSLKHKFI